MFDVSLSRDQSRLVFPSLTSNTVLTDFLWLAALALLLIATGIGLRDPWPADEPRFALVAPDMGATRERRAPAGRGRARLRARGPRQGRDRRVAAAARGWTAVPGQTTAVLLVDRAVPRSDALP